VLVTLAAILRLLAPLGDAEHIFIVSLAGAAWFLFDHVVLTLAFDDIDPPLWLSADRASGTARDEQVVSWQQPWLVGYIDRSKLRRDPTALPAKAAAAHP